MPAQLQLPLPLPRTTNYEACDFIHTASNDAALTWLDRVAEWPQGRLALWGEAGCGKTHLLHRWITATGTHNPGAQYLTGPTLPRLDELPDLPALAGLAIDNADAMADEATLLHLLNAAAETGIPVLLAARTPPARWASRLPDLASRLRAITAVELLPPDDALLRILLARLFSARQLTVSAPTQDWLVTHLPRTPTALRQAVDRLDRAALGSAAGINRPLARAELADMIDADDNAAHPESALETPALETAALETSLLETALSSALPSPPTLRLL